MTKPFLSIIIPVFNAEKTISRCIDSISKQPFKNLEIILVNDGSTDKSDTVCERYASSHSNIRVIHSINQGPGPARNQGLKYAKGTYVYFMDSDDWLADNKLHSIYETVNKEMADVIVFGYKIIRIQDGKEKKTQSNLQDLHLTTKNEIKETLCDLLNRGIRFSLWNKWFKRSIIINDNIEFPKFRRSQDVSFTLDFFKMCTSIYVIPEICYIHKVDFIPEKYDSRTIEIHTKLYQKMYFLFPDWQSNKSTNRYLSKLFAFWFFLKTPKIIISNAPSKKNAIMQIKHICKDESLKLMATELLKNKNNKIYIRFCIYLYLKEYSNFIYVSNKFLSKIEENLKLFLK